MDVPKKCPKCGSESLCKNGFNGYQHVKYTNRKQRYLCLACRYTFTLTRASTATLKNWGYSAAKRKNALVLYQTGRFSYRRLAKLLKLNEKTVRNWVLQAKMGQTPEPAA